MKGPAWLVACAALAAGEYAGFRTDKMDAALFEGFEIGLGGLISPHGAVHGGSDEHGIGHGQHRGGEEIIGDTGGNLGHGVGGGRRDDH